MTYQNKDISATLYQNYFQTDQTPSHLVSSHWKEFYLGSATFPKSNTNTTKLELGDHEHLRFHHKVLSWMTIFSYLFRLEHKGRLVAMVKKARGIAKRVGLPFTYDCFRQVCTVTLLAKYLPGNKKIRVLNIGDGYGFLSCLIKDVFPNAQLCLVDLGKTLFFQSCYCQKAYPQSNHYLVDRDSQMDAVFSEAEKANFIYCPAEILDKLDKISFDAAVNVVSMHEMTNETIKRYFAFLRDHLNEENYFYCCNRLEKHLPGGEITKFYSYPWGEHDRHIVDELCPWQRYYFGIHRTLRGLKIFGLRVPFISYFDGDIQHRLTVLDVSKVTSPKKQSMKT